MAQKAVQSTRENKLALYTPYPFQEAFHEAGRTNPERMLMCANGVGKTVSGAAETAFHLTGLYPEDWTGYRFKKPIKAWVGSITNESQRDATQPSLLGADIYENLGTGFIPRSCIIGKPRVRQAGISDVVDSCIIRHASGGTSHLFFKTYAMGWRVWQGGDPNIIWLDEEPDEFDNKQRPIFSEAQTRVVRTAGLLYVTYTPLLGETELTRHFMYPRGDGIWWKGATWEDAPHLSEEHKTRLKKTYPDYQLETRTKGLPMMGEGRVYAISEDDIMCRPFEIPRHFARICGMDFGINKNHPTAFAWLAWDRDTDVVYLYDCYRRAEAEPSIHAEACKRRGKWIPVAWPHDGVNTDKTNGKAIRDVYLEHGVNMLSHCASYDEKKLGAQPVEPIILEMQERMKTGRFKVWNTCVEWFEEFRSYHRKNGKVVAHHDDVLKASMYGLMMLRWSSPNIEQRPRMTAASGLSLRL